MEDFEIKDDVLVKYHGKEENVVIPDGVKEIGKCAFTGCLHLKSIVIPNSVIKIKERAFEDCECLENLELSNSLIEIGDSAFINCGNLTSVFIPNSVLSIGKSAFNFCCKLSDLTISNSLKCISEKVFQCTNLTSVNIPNSVVVIGKDAFKHCYRLSSVNLSDSLIEIGEDAFRHCRELTSITIPNSVKKIGYTAFNNCYNLSSVNIPNSLEFIDGLAFTFENKNLKFDKNNTELKAYIPIVLSEKGIDTVVYHKEKDLYEEGKSYKTSTVKLYKSGFCAYLNPFDCFCYPGYYNKDFVIHEVILQRPFETDHNGNSIVYASEMTVGKKLSLSEICDIYNQQCKDSKMKVGLEPVVFKKEENQSKVQKNNKLNI